jgi:hypothetical protein
MTKRERILRGLRAYFSRDRMPRLVMFVILLLTAGAGFFCSRLLLGAGLELMAVRYLVSTLAAWCVLIALVRLWIEVERRGFSSPEDLAQIAENHGDEDEDNAWERAGDAAANTLDASMNAVDDEAGCVIALLIPVVVFLLVGVLFGVFALVIGAPALLAEVFLDVVVAGFLTRGLRANDAQWWAYGVIRRTWKVALPLAALLAAFGWAMQAWFPGIRTLGDVFH